MLIAVLLLGVGGAVAASYLYPLPSFIQVRGVVPARTETLDLKVNNLTCRGKAALFIYFLERDDDYEIPGYLKVEAWPGPGYVPARIIFDPAKAAPDAIRKALTEPYFDQVGNVWRNSPFELQGYDPLAVP